MTRYYLSPVVGNGTRDDPYRAKIQNFGVSFVSVIRTGSDGKPLKNWCLCLVNTDNHVPLLADTELDALPNLLHSVQWDQLPLVARQRLKTKLATLGVTLDETGPKEFREIVRQIGRALDATFHEDAFSVG